MAATVRTAVRMMYMTTSGVIDRRRAITAKVGTARMAKEAKKARASRSNQEVLASYWPIRRKKAIPGKMKSKKAPRLAPPGQAWSNIERSSRNTPPSPSTSQSSGQAARYLGKRQPFAVGKPPLITDVNLMSRVYAVG
jgi:hypothetical protein